MKFLLYAFFLTLGIMIALIGFVLASSSGAALVFFMIGSFVAGSGMIMTEEALK